MSICVTEEKKQQTPLINQRAPLDERFSIVCEDEHLYALFEQFLVTQFSVENLHFYNDVSQLHALTDAAEIAAACERVCKTYFGHDGSDAVLNVNEMIRAQVLKNLGRPSVHMFDMAYNDVEQLLKTLYITFLGGPSALTTKPKKSGFSLSCVSDEE